MKNSSISYHLDSERLSQQDESMKLGDIKIKDDDMQPVFGKTTFDNIFINADEIHSAEYSTKIRNNMNS